MKSNLVFNPDLTQEGHYDITFYASSGAPSLRDTLIVGVDVLHSNAAPILNPIGPRTVDENQQLSFVVTTSDIDGQSPALQALNLPANTAFTDSLNGHGLFVFIPSYFQSGSYNVQLTVTNGCGINSSMQKIINLSVDIKNQSLANNIEISPNPTNSFIVIKINSDRFENASISIVDIIGNKIYEKDEKLIGGSNLFRIDISENKQGIYIICVSTPSRKFLYKILKKE